MFAPTVVRVMRRSCIRPKKPVGAKLARDSGGSACRDVECVSVIASRLAPTVFRVLRRRCIRPKKPVGAKFARDSGGSACRSEEHTSELQSLMRISYAVFCLKKKKTTTAVKHATRQSKRISHTL